MCTHSITAFAPQIRFWRPTDGIVGVQGTGRKIWRPNVYKLINERIDELDAELRELNLDIHGTCRALCATRIFNVRYRSSRTWLQRIVSTVDRTPITSANSICLLATPMILLQPSCRSTGLL